MKRSKTLRETVLFCLGIALAVLLIQAAGSLKGDRLVFPDAGEIGRTFLRLLGEGRTWTLIGTTMLHWSVSLAAAFAAGILAGLAEGLIPGAHSLLKPLMMMLRSLPMIVLVIMIMVLAKYRYVPLIASAMAVFPLISEGVYEGIVHIEPELIDVYRINSSFTPRVLFRVYLPLISGYMKAAFINAAGMGLKVTVTSEYLVQTRESLGKAVFTSSYFNEYAEIYAYALIMVLLIVLVTGIPEIMAKTWRKLKPYSASQS
ncbi:MAG: ABC transporter permease subunit [Clostridiales bacterium]|nr:ABC transporter permease subunit [Clostridiales bacterium]